MIVGPTGIGKTWIGCALAQAACRLGFTAAYHCLPRLLEDLALAHGDGRFPKLLAALAKTDLLVLDDWGLAPLAADQRRDLLELLDDRHARRSTLVTSQLPVDHWHAYLGDPTLADAILDRLVHNAYRLHLIRRIPPENSNSLGGHLRQRVTITFPCLPPSSRISRICWGQRGCGSTATPTTHSTTSWPTPKSCATRGATLPSN